MPETIHNGSTGAGVKDAQGKLRKISYYTGLVDGRFGDKMEASVRKFQDTKNAAEVNGIIGDQTWTMLNSAAGTSG